MSVAAVLAIIYGVKQIAQDGVGLPSVLAILGGLAIGVAFVARQRALADPMIDLGLFRITAFNVALATNFLASFVAVGYFLFVAQYLQLVIGMSPLQAGLWSLPSAFGFIVGSQLGPRAVGRVRPALVIGGGLALAAVGLGLLTQAGVSDALPLLVTGSVIISLGLAPVFGMTTELIVGAAPPQQAGAASGISETGSELGGALGIAAMGSIGVAIYRGQLADQLPRGCRPRWPPPPATPWAAPSPSPASSQRSSAAPWSRPPATPSSPGCSSAPSSSPWWPSGWPSWPWSTCATGRPPPAGRPRTRGWRRSRRPAMGSRSTRPPGGPSIGERTVGGSKPPACRDRERLPR
jgi:hypothetical protein